MSMDDGTTFPTRPSTPRQTATRLTQIMRDLMGPDSKPFRPIARYDRDLDWVTVIVKDCSPTHEWVGGELTIITNTHTNELVGFVIEAAQRHICRDLEKTLGEATVEEMLRQTVSLKQSKLSEWLDPCLGLVRQLDSPHVTLP
jgi:hypothetical protein